LLFLILRVIDL